MTQLNIGTQTVDAAKGNTDDSSQTEPQQLLSQRQLFEQAWAEHEKGAHPDQLRLHVERRAHNAKVLTFREMCGDCSCISPTELKCLKRVGEGTFATVDIGRYTPPGGKEQIVAVKKMTGTAAIDVADFACEANILRKLQHENIVKFIGVGSAEEDSLVKDHEKTDCFLVQEYMDAGTLKQKVWNQAVLMYQVYSDHDAVEWAKQIADGLAYLHSANPVYGASDAAAAKQVLHRDLKLENILLKRMDSLAKPPRLQAKICDFGLAVSLLDPHFKFREAASPAVAPSGLSISPGNGKLLKEMQLHVQGESHLSPELRTKADRMDAKLDSLAVKPSVKRGKSMSRAKPMSSASGSRSQRKLKMKKSSKELQDCSANCKHEAYYLTGRAGSFLYMAPEVVMSEPYNEKADIFSLGVILLELFIRKPLAAVLMEMEKDGKYDPDLPEMFAYKVAGGYRHPIPRDWPQELRQLISECWAQNPDKRPQAAEIAIRLGKLESGELFRKWQEIHSREVGSCCTVM